MRPFAPTLQQQQQEEVSRGGKPRPLQIFGGSRHRSPLPRASPNLHWVAEICAQTRSAAPYVAGMRGTRGKRRSKAALDTRSVAIAPDTRRSCPVFVRARVSCCILRPFSKAVCPDLPPSHEVESSISCRSDWARKRKRRGPVRTRFMHMLKGPHEIELSSATVHLARQLCLLCVNPEIYFDLCLTGGNPSVELCCPE